MIMNKYKTVFLDTNVISNISKNENRSFEGFYNRFSPEFYIPCFSIYNIVELKNSDNGQPDNAYERFIRMFSIYPCCLVKTYSEIIQDEIDNYDKKEQLNIVFQPFSALSNNKAMHLDDMLKSIWGNKQFCKIAEHEGAMAPEVAATWENLRAGHKIGDVKYTKQYEKTNMYILFTNEDKPYRFSLGYDFEVERFPGARIMLFSQFRKVYLSRKQIGKNDVMDVMISSITPYVNAVCTENSQAETLKQAKNNIRQIKNLEIVKMSDLVIEE